MLEGEGGDVSAGVTRGHIEVAAEGTGGITGGRGGSGGSGRVRRCECDIEFAPWRRACYRQCPTAGPEAICSLCDEIYESFQRSRGGQLLAREKERERASVRRSRACGKTCARCPFIQVSSPGTCSARFCIEVMSG